MNKKKRDNFIKIQYGCRIVLVLIFLILSAILINLCYSTLAKEMAESKRIFENEYQVIESKIRGFEKTSDSLFANKDVRSFAMGLTEGYSAYSVVPVSKMISLLESFFTEGQYRVILTNLDQEICVRSGGSENFSTIYKELSLNDEIISKIKNSSAKEKLYFYDREKGVISFVFQHHYGQKIGKLFCFVIVDVNAFLPKDNFVIADIKDSSFDNSSYKQIVRNGNVYMKESLCFPGLIYQYTARNSGLLLCIILGVCIMLCLICAFYNRKISDRVLNLIYMPLIMAARVSGTSDSSWDTTAKKLIYNSELLQSNYAENKKFRKKTYLKNLLYDIEDYQDKYVDEFELKWLDTNCRVVLIEFAGQNEYITTRDKFFDGEIDKLVGSQISTGVSGEMVILNDERCAYITNSCAKEELQKKLVKILDFAELYGMEAFVAVGCEVGSLKDIKISFREANDCIERKSAFSLSSVIFSDDCVKKTMNFYYPIDLELMLIDHTLLGELDDVEKILDELLEQNLQGHMLDDNQIREFKIMVVGTVNRIINRMGKTINDIFTDSSSVYLEIGVSRNKKEFTQNVKSVFGVLCELNEKDNLSKQDRLSKEIMAYIEENYSDPELSLESLARAFYISQNHVSRVLKSKIGKSYKEYLNDIRISQAKHLLKTTPMTISNIASKVGYTDIRAFNRLFKKYTNHTPNEYRLMHQEDNV